MVTKNTVEEVVAPVVEEVVAPVVEEVAAETIESKVKKLEEKIDELESLIKLRT